MMDASQIGKRAWSYAGVLQDAGLSCFEYVEQLTLLLFLKMADQLTEPPHSRKPLVPPDLGWQALLPLDGAWLEEKYREILEKLALKSGMLGVIFKSARCEINNPALLKQLIVNLLDKVDWLSLPVDVMRDEKSIVSALRQLRTWHRDHLTSGRPKTKDHQQPPITSPVPLMEAEEQAIPDRLPR
jgi:type I restriction enzyme M protein